MTYRRNNLFFEVLGGYFLILISGADGFLSVDLPRENPFNSFQGGSQRKAPLVSSQRIGSYRHDNFLNGPLQKRSTIAPLNLVPPSGAEWETLATGTPHFLTAAVPTFDGSGIVDPVVVSNAFWDGLTRQFVSLIIGQFLAASVFGLITTLAASQMNKLGTFMTENVIGQIFSNNQKDRKSSSLKQPPPGYTGPPLKVTPDIPKLLVCIVIDLIGTSSELIPLVGELSDIAWAPVAALLLRSLYGGSNVIFVLEFAEEILPFTDILPLATICWAVDTFFRDSEIAKLLQLGIYREVAENDLIDTTTSRTQSHDFDTNISKRKKIQDDDIIDVEVDKIRRSYDK